MTKHVAIHWVLLIFWCVFLCLFFAKPLQSMWLRARAGSQLYAEIITIEPRFHFGLCPIMDGLPMNLSETRKLLIKAIAADANQASSYWLLDLLNCIDQQEPFDNFTQYINKSSDDRRAILLNWITSTNQDQLIQAINTDDKFRKTETLIIYGFLIEKYQGTEGFPVILTLLEKNPTNVDLWQQVILEQRQLLRNLEPNDHLKFLSELLSLQEKLSVSINRDEIYLLSGYINQFMVEPRDPETALFYYELSLKTLSDLSIFRQSSLHTYIGDAYRTLNYPTDQILVEYFAALALNPKNYSAVYGIGNVYLFMMEDIPVAREYFLEMTKILPENPSGYYWVGYSYEKEGNILEAVRFYETALMKQSDYAAAINRLEIIKNSGNK